MIIFMLQIKLHLDFGENSQNKHVDSTDTVTNVFRAYFGTATSTKTNTVVFYETLQSRGYFW
jgi:hypothetical protein